MGLGSEIRDSEKNYSGSRIPGSKRHRIPDPEVKKAPDPGSGSATLGTFIQLILCEDEEYWIFTFSDQTFILPQYDEQGRAFVEARVRYSSLIISQNYTYSSCCVCYTTERHVDRAVELGLFHRSTSVADPGNFGTDPDQYLWLTDFGSGSGSCYFRRWPSSRQKAFFSPSFFAFFFWSFIYINS